MPSASILKYALYVVGQYTCVHYILSRGIKTATEVTHNWIKATLLFFSIQCSYNIYVYGIIAANCTEGSVRQINGSRTRGRLLEVCFDETWGSVCLFSNGSFGPREAAVVCRQLGLPFLGTCILYHCRSNGYIPLLYCKSL